MKKEHTEVDVSEEVAQPILIWASQKRKEKEKRTNQISVLQQYYYNETVEL